MPVVSCACGPTGSPGMTDVPSGVQRSCPDGRCECHDSTWCRRDGISVSRRRINGLPCQALDGLPNLPRLGFGDADAVVRPDLGGLASRSNAPGACRPMTAVSWSVVTERQLTVAVGRRAARAILIDDRDRLVLIRRTKPGQVSYWTAPGGGVEDTDASVEAALHRELAEELGAEASGVSRVFLFSSRPMQGSPSSTSLWLG